ALELLIFDIRNGNGRRRRRLAGLTRLAGLARLAGRIAGSLRRRLRRHGLSRLRDLDFLCREAGEPDQPERQGDNGSASAPGLIRRCARAGTSRVLWARRRLADGTRSIPATLGHAHLALFLAGAGALAGAAAFAGAAFGAVFGGGGRAASGSS